MTILEYINDKTMHALLDDKQPVLNGLLEAAKLAIGSVCPEGHGEAVISFGHDGEAYCEACDERYSLTQAAVDKLHDLGFYDVYAE
jgi:hypothetical protein